MNVTASGDLAFQSENTSSSSRYVTVRANNGSAINIDMQGHNLTARNNGDVVIQCANETDGLPASLSITNAKDVVVELGNSYGGNAILCWEGNIKIQGDSLSVDHLQRSGCTLYPSVAVGRYNGGDLILHAKEDINIVNDAGHGIYSDVLSSGVLGANYELTSDNGLINISVDGPSSYAALLIGTGTASFNSNTKITSAYRGVNVRQAYEANFPKALEINSGSEHALVSQTAGKINSLSFTDPKKITGNLWNTDTDSEINLNMGTADSVLTGYTKETGGTITLPVILALILLPRTGI